MSNGNAADNDVPEPTVLALAPSLDAITFQLAHLVAQLDRLYEQRHFELQQKYGAQSFLDFEEHQRHARPPVTHRPDEPAPTRDPSQSTHERDDQQN